MEEATKVLRARYDRHEVVWPTTYTLKDKKIRDYTFRSDVNPDSECARDLQQADIGSVQTSEEGPVLKLTKGIPYSGRLEYFCGLWSFDRVTAIEALGPTEAKVRFEQHQEEVPAVCQSLLKSCPFTIEVPSRTTWEIILRKDTKGFWYPVFWTPLDAATLRRFM